MLGTKAFFYTDDSPINQEFPTVTSTFSALCKAMETTGCTLLPWESTIYKHPKLD